VAERNFTPKNGIGSIVVHSVPPPFHYVTGFPQPENAPGKVEGALPQKNGHLGVRRYNSQPGGRKCLRRNVRIELGLQSSRQKL